MEEEKFEIIDSDDTNKELPTVVTFDERGHQNIVRKSNSLVQLAMDTLSLQQQKMMLHIFAMIKPTDTELPEYELTVSEFAHLCNINARSGSIYRSIKKNLAQIMESKVQWISVPGTKAQRSFRWIQRAEVNSSTRKIHIWLDAELKPHLIQLKTFYTTFNILYTMPMRSQYSIRVYELCKSYQNFYEKNRDEGKPFLMSVEMFKQQVACAYKNWADIRRYVLEKAKQEINGHTDIIFDYNEYTRTGNKVKEIELIIESEKKELAGRNLTKLEENSKTSLKKRKKKKDSLLIYDDDSPQTTLPYVSSCETTIPYSFALDRELMTQEIKIRAEYDDLTNELSQKELDCIETIIMTMASMAAVTGENVETIDGGNAEFFQSMNEIIMRTGSLKTWFLGICDRYMSSVLPASLKKSSPLPYLSKVILNDLLNYKLYPEKKREKNPSSNNEENIYPVIEMQKEHVKEIFDNSQLKKKTSLSNILTREDALTKKTMVEKLKSSMNYNDLIKSLTKGQYQALEEITTIIATLCRRNQKGKDDGMMDGKANTTFIEPLNNVIKEYGSLQGFFEYLASTMDYDIYWENLSQDESIKNPTLVFASSVEKAVITAIGTMHAAQARNKQAQNGPVTKAIDPDSMIGRAARKNLNYKKETTS